MSDHPESYAARLKREGREKTTDRDGERTPSDRMVDKMKAMIHKRVVGTSMSGEPVEVIEVRAHTSDGRKIKHPASPEAIAKLSASLKADEPTQLDRIEATLKKLVEKHG
jgi:hypothetical protein